MCSAPLFIKRRWAGHVVRYPTPLVPGMPSVFRPKSPTAMIDRGLCSRDLARIAEVRIEHQVGGEDMADAESDILDAAQAAPGWPPSKVPPPAAPSSCGSVTVNGSMLYLPKMLVLGRDVVTLVSDVLRL